nr:hypothetical protein CFP56_38800 [Quercus suber]
MENSAMRDSRPGPRGSQSNCDAPLVQRNRDRAAGEHGRASQIPRGPVARPRLGKVPSTVEIKPSAELVVAEMRLTTSRWRHHDHDHDACLSPPQSCPSHFRQEIALFTIASPWLGSRDVRADVRRSRSVQMQCHDSIEPSCRVRGAIALSLEGTVSIMGIIIADGVSLARQDPLTHLDLIPTRTSPTQGQLSSCSVLQPPAEPVPLLLTRPPRAACAFSSGSVDTSGPPSHGAVIRSLHFPFESCRSPDSSACPILADRREDRHLCDARLGAVRTYKSSIFPARLSLEDLHDDRSITTPPAVRKRPGGKARDLVTSRLGWAKMVESSSGVEIRSPLICEPDSHALGDGSMSAKPVMMADMIDPSAKIACKSCCAGRIFHCVSGP